MKLTEQDFKNYKLADEMISEYKQKINQINKESTVFDHTKGSNIDHPYTEHNIPVIGIVLKPGASEKIREYNLKIHDLKIKRELIDKAFDEIKDFKVRKMLKAVLVDCRTISDVAEEYNVSSRTLIRYKNNFLKCH